MSELSDEEYAERLRADPATWEWVAWAKEHIRDGSFDREIAVQPSPAALVAEIKARRAPEHLPRGTSITFDDEGGWESEQREQPQ